MQEQEQLGRLYGKLSKLVGAPIHTVNEEMPKLVAEYGAENIEWMLGVIAEDSQS